VFPIKADMLDTSEQTLSWTLSELQSFA